MSDPSASPSTSHPGAGAPDALPPGLPPFPRRIPECTAGNATPYLVDLAQLRGCFAGSARREALLDGLDSLLQSMREARAQPVALLLGGSFLEVRQPEPRDLDAVCFYVAQDAVPELERMNESSGVEQALRTGDRAQVTAVLRAAGSNPTMFSLAEALLDGDAERVLDLAAACVEGAFAAGAVPAAVHCNHILAGTYFRQGNFPAWATRMRWFQETGLPALQTHAGRTGTGRLGGPFDELDYARLEAGPRLAVELGDGQVLLPDLTPGKPSDWNPSITLRINGKDVSALVDTGAQVPLVLSQAAALRLGVTELARDLPLLGSSLTGMDPARRDRLAVADAVEIGPLTLRHQGLVVSGGDELGEVQAVVGLPVLQRFHAIRLQRRGLTVSGQAIPGCEAGGTRYSFAADEKGSSKLLLPATWQDRELLAVLDTGMMGALTATGTLASELGANTLPSAPVRVRSAGGAAMLQAAELDWSIQVAGQPVRDGASRLFSALRGDHSLWLGASLLDQRQVVLDFVRHRVCLLPEGSAAAGPDPSTPEGNEGTQAP